MDIPRVKWSGGQRNSSAGRSVPTSRECLNLANHFSGSAREQQREDYWTVSVSRDYVFSPGSAQQLSQSHLSSPSIPILSPPSPSPSPPAGHTLFSAPNQVAPFFAASIKGQRGKTTSLCWSCGSMSRGLRTTMGEGERVTDCFDGQTLRFFPSPHSILLFAPEIRSHLFFFHRQSILP